MSDKAKGFVGPSTVQAVRDAIDAERLIHEALRQNEITRLAQRVCGIVFDAEICRLRSEVADLREALAAVDNLEWVAPHAPDDALVIMTAGAVRKMRRALLSNRGEE